MKSAIIFAVLFAVVFSFQNEHLVHRFKEWMNKYEKSYKNEIEYTNRFETFVQNVDYVEKLNQRNDGATYELNQFADMSQEEFKTYPCGGALTKERLGESELEIPESVLDFDLPKKVKLPQSWDWTTHKGVVSHVKNQGMCGSCWAFSTTGTIEGRWKLTGHNATSLSEQQQIDCDKTSFGCRGGWPAWAMTDMLQNDQGIADTERAYPYRGQDGQCNFKASEMGAKIKGYKVICATEVPHETSPCQETQMMNLLVNHGPLSACFDASGMQFYHGGVQNPSNCQGQIDHCVLIVGYGEDNGQKFWKIKNSWGTQWGEQGYYRLIRGTSNPNGVCQINRDITIAQI